MFLIDVSSTMGKTRDVEVELPNGETQIIEMSNLEYGLQYVKLKIQEMVDIYSALYTGRIDTLSDLQRPQDRPVRRDIIRHRRCRSHNMHDICAYTH